MLDTDTKRRIDTARDILVGKVPDPKSQVEQITIALIYKFMDDMDAESEELGGKRSFFAGEFARYGWARLMSPALGGYEMRDLYEEGMKRMQENPGIPSLFRNIFNGAKLPYSDPETLRAFLKIINEFAYDHSERLGDAYEHLLSVLGSQGQAGQFRTPRHIIDFIVAIVDPKKHESILDPACGSAGFLISSYKHILRSNQSHMDKQDSQDNNPESCISGLSMSDGSLTPEDKDRLARNIQGYDIDPLMVRLSLVNMYLHGFAEPHIYEYDTLTSQDKWIEYADVILANPPFMSPKGGIKPHTRFAIQAKRSEVLFVDYMAEHLTPQGRAGIIVPEGIIFQSQTAYRQLRKMLVDEYLVAVVSLPAGVFQPYSGVKTSILILDKALARQSDTIAFYKVENDGFGLGAQRREIEANDLPAALAAIKDYQLRIKNGEDVTSDQSLIPDSQFLIVPKARIAANGDYNLSGERYRENGKRPHTFEMVSLASITLSKPQYGSGASKVPYDGKVRYVRITDLTDGGDLKSEDPVSPSVIEPDCFLQAGDLLIARSGSVGRTYLHRDTDGIFQYAGYLIRFRPNPEFALPEFVFQITHSNSWRDWILSNSKTGTLTNINAQQYASFRFPLPPLEVQKEIVAEIEGYQKVIDGARAVIDNYRPHIPIHPDWPMVKLGEPTLFRIESGGTPKTGTERYWNGGIPWATLVDLPACDFISTITTTQRTISSEGLRDSSASLVPVGSIIVSTRATIGRIAINRVPIATNQGFKNIVVIAPGKAIPEYVALALTKLVPVMDVWATGGTFKEISKAKFSELKIPLPPLKTQQAIVAEIEAEQALVNANRELISRMEKKIKAVMDRVWGEDIT